MTNNFSSTNNGVIQVPSNNLEEAPLHPDAGKPCDCSSSVEVLSSSSSSTPSPSPIGSSPIVPPLRPSKKKSSSTSSPSNLGLSPVFFDAAKELAASGSLVGGRAGSGSSSGSSGSSPVTLSLVHSGRKKFTIVEGLRPPVGVSLEDVCRLLRKGLCCGAAVKGAEDGERVIEVQGSWQAEIASLLKSKGWCEKPRRRG